MGWIVHVCLQLPQGGTAAGKLIIDWSHVTTRRARLQDSTTPLCLHERKSVKSSNHLVFIHQPWQPSHLWLSWGAHTQQPERPGPSVGFSIYDNECREKQQPRFQEYTMSKRSISLATERRKMRKKTEKNKRFWYQQWDCLPTWHSETCVRTLEPPSATFLARRTSWGLSVSLEVTPKKTLLSGDKDFSFTARLN